ncbi:MAG: apolipoprotein N-acyltransferase [Pseudomonadota bacterium]
MTLGINIPRSLSLLLSILGGLLTGLSVLNFETNLFFLGWVGWVPLLFVIASPGRKAGGAFFYGWVMGVVTHLMGFYWLCSTMVRFGKIPVPLAFAIFLLGFAFTSGLSYGIIAMLAKMMLRRKVPVAIALPVAVMIGEFFFPHLFPWTVAMSLWTVPVTFQTAEIWGICGISGILAAVNAAVFRKIAHDAGWLAGSRGTNLTVRIVGALVCFILLYGIVRMDMVDHKARSFPSVNVGIVQPNVSLERKYNPSYAMRTLWLLQSASLNLEQQGAQIVVWPESAYPFRIPRGQKTDSEGARRITTHTGIPIIVGAVSYGEGRAYNSTFIATPEGRLIGPSDKNNLVLFGEHNPLADMVPGPVKKRFPKATSRGLTPGDRPVILSHMDLRVGVLNCLEDILSNYTAGVVRTGANILVNITNDAWFGDSAEPYQHLSLAVFRTVETRREMVRSVNTGVSAAVDLNGRLKYISGTYRQEFVVERMVLSDMKTPYQATGNLLRWLCVAFFVMVLVSRVLGPRPG